MKLKKIVMGILLALLVIVGIEGMISFWAEHNYYAQMIFSRRNLGLLGSAALCAWIPLSYLNSKKKLTLKRFVLGLGIGLGLFSFLHALLTGALLTLFALIPLLFNTLLLYLLAVSFLFGIFGLGHRIARKLKLFQTIRRQETLLTFGLGLVVFLVLMQILMGIQLFYSLVIWLIFAGMLFLAWKERKQMKVHEEAILGVFEQFQTQKKASKFGWIWTLLLLFSLGYYFFSFSHSYIPYSTAWDANHEYMYTPKVIAENAGILRGNTGPAAGMPYLWHSFIAFFFSLWAPVASVLNIAKDTVAVNLNALSGILVLIFGLGAIKEILAVFHRKDTEEKSQTSFLLGWSLILMWLTSGMGAFLVFVDNKTDMGVLALSILAILGGMIFFHHFQKKGVHTDSAQSTKYLLLSAIFFAFAVMAKPTAFIDVVIFALLMVGFWLNTTTLVGTGIATLGLMGVVQPLFTAAFITPALGKLIFIVGVAIAVVGGIRGIVGRNEQFSKSFKHIVIWGMSLVAGLFIFKGPWVAVRSLTSGDFQFGTFVKSTLLAQADSSKEAENTDSKAPVFLAQTLSIETLEAQSEIDRSADLAASQDLSYAQCLRENNDEADLNSTKQKAPGSAINEDVGRYVGFAWREFKKTGVGGGLLKLFFWKNNACFGWDTDGVLLCKHRELFEKNDLTKLKNLTSQLSVKGNALSLANALLEAHEKGEDLRDKWTALKTYYQEHSILTSESSIFIPYRYIVPLNVVFNWSLQNHSSYYTDIGLIWLCVFVVMIVGLAYAILSYDKKHKQLLFLSFATLIGWAIWRAIGGGIVWYGLGLILWSIFTFVALFQEREEQENPHLRTRYLWLVGLFACYLAIQALFNGARIASQAGSGPFEQYKSNVGEKQWVGENLDYSIKTVYNFDAQDIFALQFGQYQPFMDAVKERKDEEGILIAGTYLQYFLKNQKNLILDGMLTWLREEMSDFNSCRSYQRLKNEHLKYLVIDPNIGTVGRAGEGNESLFHRFFARLSADEQQIETHGAITMLVKMAQEGYLKLIYTNNIGAKYAFELSDKELIATFGEKSKEELLLLRSKMAVAKFFHTDLELLNSIFQIFQQRISNGKGISDLANILGKQLSEEKLLNAVQTLLAGKTPQLNEFSQDERLVLSQYLGLYRLMTSGQAQQAQNTLTQLFQNSIAGSSQVITLELR